MKYKGQPFTIKDLLRGIRRKCIDVLGLDLMSEQFSMLALNYVFIMIYYTLEIVFVNTLLFRVSGGDMYSVLTYRGITFACCAVGMNICAAFAGRIPPIRAMKIAGGMYLALFGVMLFGMEDLSSLMYVMGALSGLGQGFYWSGHNVLLTLYSTPRNRAVGLGIVGIIQGVMTLLVPLISGWVIQLMPEMIGYRVMFGIAMGVVAVQFYFMNKLQPVARKHKPHDFRFAFKLVTHKLTLKLMLAFEMVRGLRDGAFAFFLNMVLFEIVTSESLVGFNSFLTGVVSIIAAWAFGKLTTPETRVRNSAIAVAGLFGFCLLLLLKVNAAIIILFGVVNTFLSFFLNNSAVSYTFDLVGQNETLRGVMTELMGFRQTALDIGRVSGLVIISLFPKNLSGYISAMLVLTGVQFLTVFLLYLTKRVQERKLHRPAPEAEA